MPRYKVQVTRFPYGGLEHSHCVDWLCQLSVALDRDPRFEVSHYRINDTPVTMTRNRVLRAAVEKGIDFLLLVDSDMAPDCELGADPTAKPFWHSSIDFMLAHEGPCVVAAPYCGPPPHENVYVFRWTNRQGGHPNVDLALDQYGREEAAQLAGIQRVDALPTGVMLVDVRALTRLPVPYTYYEYDDEGPPCQTCGVRAPGPQSHKASTEDVTFTRDLGLAGVPQYCNWDAWAGHMKTKMVRKPVPYTSDIIAARMHAAVRTAQTRGERLIDVRGRRNGQPDAGVEAAKAAYFANQVELSAAGTRIAANLSTDRAPAADVVSVPMESRTVTVPNTVQQPWLTPADIGPLDLLDVQIPPSGAR